MLSGFLVLSSGEFLRAWGVFYVGAETRVTHRVGASKLVTSGAFGHVRNPLYVGNILIYVDWALDALPVELLQEKDIDLVRIIYRKELNYGSIIKSCAEVIVEEGKTITLHSIVDAEGRDACNIEFHWR